MNKILTAFYILLILFTALYSYVLVDPNITFVQSKYWVMFREFVIQIGYYRRDISWVIYLCIVTLLFLSHFYFIKKYKEISVLHLAIMIGVILLFSYPFLSHDLFNYMFDARIFTFYGKNPYLFKALDFPADQWTRFMHWTHRTYPYGPVFLILSFIPSILGLGKFTLTFILFKGMFVGFYLISVYLLSKMNNKWAVIFATHPLIIIEGLISSHNDMAALGLGLIGIYFMFNKTRQWWGRLLLLCSAGIKYTTVALLGISKPAKNKYMNWNILVFAGQVAILIYLSYRMGVQPWYFLVLFAFIPLFSSFISKLNIFFFGLLVSYYPYIRLGGWDTQYKVLLRHQISGVFIAVNILFLIIYFFSYLPQRHKDLKKSSR